MKLIKKGKMTSLELLEQINLFREQEGKNKLFHRDLLKVIRDEFSEEINEGNFSPVEYMDKKGEKRPMYIMSFSQAKQVLARESKTVRKAVFKDIEKLEEKIQELMIAEINKRNTEWLSTRRKGKLVRRNETDLLAEFIFYAKEQGSKNADMYYVIFSKLVNKLVGIETGMRDKIDITVLNHIANLENIILATIEERMQNKVYYKEIYEECKTKCEQYKSLLQLHKIEIKMVG